MIKKTKKRQSKSKWAIGILIFSLALLSLGLVGIAAYKKGYNDAQVLAETKQIKVQEKQKKLLEKITNIAAPKNDLVGKLQIVLNREQKKAQIDTKHEFDSNTLGRPPKGPKRIIKKEAYILKF